MEVPKTRRIANSTIQGSPKHSNPYSGLLICVWRRAFGDAFELHGWQLTSVYYNALSGC